MRGATATHGVSSRVEVACRVEVASFLPRRVRLDLRAALEGRTLATDVVGVLHRAFGPGARVAWNPLTGRSQASTRLGRAVSSPHF
mgnify:CR=1 FL=1